MYNGRCSLVKDVYLYGEIFICMDKSCIQKYIS